MTHRLRAGMVGGGAGANIGVAHRYAMRLDDRYELVAGVFGRDAIAALAFARDLGLDEQRIYADYEQMAESEARRPDGVEVVVVATPNDSHFAIAKAFLEHGVSVLCEKPLTTDSASAAELVRIAQAHGEVLAVAHVYSAYAMVRQAAQMVRDGEIGNVRFIDVEHASGWASTLLESTGHKQASWRTDPAVGGRLSVVADLGTHAHHLARYVTGLEVRAVSAQLDTLVPGRQIFDNATVQLRWSGDVPGRLWASMAAAGHSHGLRLRVFGDRGNVEWSHQDPDQLIVQDLECRTTILSQGVPSLATDSRRLDRVGLGHAEGFIEAFANLYGDVADDLLARRERRPSTIRELSFPTGVDGLKGLEFIEAVGASGDAGGAWVTLGEVGEEAT